MKSTDSQVNFVRRKFKHVLRTIEHTFRLAPGVSVNGILEEGLITEEQTGYKLIGLGTASDGAIIDASILMNEIYSDIEALEWNLSRFWRHEPLELMDLTYMTAPAIERWERMQYHWAQMFTSKMKSVSEVAEIPEEQMEVMPDGRLRIFTEFRGQAVEMFVEANEWRWRNIVSPGH